MDDNRWMERALVLAGQAAAAGEVPVGAVLVREGIVLVKGTINLSQAMTRPRMQKSWPCGRQRPLNKTTACREAPFMSRWSPAPCASVPWSTPVSHGLSTRPVNHVQAFVKASCICQQWNSITTGWLWREGC